LPVKHIAKALYEQTPNMRHIVIIDACYASGAVPAFMEQDIADPVGVVRQQVREILPETDIMRGSALFCAAGPKTAAKAPSDGAYTMFSGALKKVLTTGDPTFQEYLSLEDLAGLVERDILNTFRDEMVRPELHTPRREAGDIRTLWLFPNPARRKDAGPRWRAIEAAIQGLREEFTIHTVALQSH